MDKEKLIKRADALEKELNKLRNEINKPINLFKKIKNYSDVCKELNISKSICPYQKIKHIEKLFNENWKKDWLNQNQPKYYPYFKYNKTSGLVFCYSCYICHGFYGVVGFYKDKETSDFIGETFIDIYKEIALS